MGKALESTAQKIHFVSLPRKYIWTYTLIVCVAFIWVWNEMFELTTIWNITGKSFGFYSFYEIYRWNGRLQRINRPLADVRQICSIHWNSKSILSIKFNILTILMMMINDSINIKINFGGKNILKYI